MNDDDNNKSDCVIDISEDNAENGLKEDEQLHQKYFNGNKVILTKINVENKRKKITIAKRPLGKWELRFLIITVLVIFSVLFLGYIYLMFNE